MFIIEKPKVKTTKNEQALNRLNYINDKAPTLLSKINEENISVKKLPNKWSKKELLGHLIDCATYNHQRLVRGQFENNPEISYGQNKWNEYSFYQEIDSPQIIKFWKRYEK